MQSELDSPPRLLSMQELSDWLQVPIKTLYDWRHKGEGPPTIRVGRHLRFDPADIADWLNARKQAS